MQDRSPPLPGPARHSSPTFNSVMHNRSPPCPVLHDTSPPLQLVLLTHEDALPAEIPVTSIEALGRLHAEWERTVRGLEAVDPDGADDTRAWERTVAVAQDQAAIFVDRRAAAESDDEEAIFEAFSPAPGETFPQFAALGLDRRSCAGSWL